MYAHYTGQCVGRLLHFLYEYGIPFYSDMIFDGKGNITLHGRVFATYTWDDNTDVPTFKFEGNWYLQIDRKGAAKLYEEIQTRMKPRVLELAKEREYWKEFHAKQKQENNDA